MLIRKTKIAALAAAILAALSLVAPVGAQSVETIDKGTLAIAFSGDMPGTGFQDGKMIGYDGEILQRIAETLHLKVRPQLMEWSGTIASVQSKRVDIMGGTMGWTEQRSKIMLLSEPIHYFKNGIAQIDKNSWSHELNDGVFRGRLVPLLPPASFECFTASFWGLCGW